MTSLDPAALSRSIAAAATSSDDGRALIAQFCSQMVEAGLPLWRMGIGMPALDALSGSFSMTWRADTEVAMVRTAHGAATDLAYAESPIRMLIDQGSRFGRWWLADPEAEPFALLRDFRAEGATEYVLHMVPFAPGTALRGVALSFVTRHEEGFTADHLACIADLVPTLGLAMAKLALAHTLRRTLDTYLGSQPSRQILDGRITRGEGQTVSAAILLADLRGFTALAERSDPEDVVVWLDEHLEALGEPVLQRGGEILKFLGDGFLAIFPVNAPETLPCDDCAQALEAALAAVEANDALNRNRTSRGLPTLDVAMVLHFGAVIYGNVGTRERLDFTIIGRAVNEASRMEKACGDLGQCLLISDSFAHRLDQPLRDLGMVPLRGLERARRVWTVGDRETAPCAAPHDLAGEGGLRSWISDAEGSSAGTGRAPDRSGSRSPA